MSIWTELDTPIGTLRLHSNGLALTAIEFENRYELEGQRGEDKVLHEACRQLGEYFAGERRRFDLPLQAGGTEFQQQVWTALQHIPWGETRSYGELACELDNPKAVRAVGAANGRNPLPIVVPCHRVIGSNGKLTGFAGGLAAKHALLALEGVLTTDLPLQN